MQASRRQANNNAFDPNRQQASKQQAGKMHLQNCSRNLEVKLGDFPLHLANDNMLDWFPQFGCWKPRSGCYCGQSPIKAPFLVTDSHYTMFSNAWKGKRFLQPFYKSGNRFMNGLGHLQRLHLLVLLSPHGFGFQPKMFEGTQSLCFFRRAWRNGGRDHWSLWYSRCHHTSQITKTKRHTKRRRSKERDLMWWCLCLDGWWSQQSYFPPPCGGIFIVFAVNILGIMEGGS